MVGAAEIKAGKEDKVSTVDLAIILKLANGMTATNRTVMCMQQCIYTISLAQVLLKSIMLVLATDAETVF